MRSENDFKIVFDNLKSIMKRYSADFVCTINEDDNYYLNTDYIMKNKQPMYFGSVQIRKNYVSYHLMPVYIFPGLLESMSPALKKRMQGKSCFNFKSVDDALFSELELLTQAGREAFKKAGYIK